MLLHQVHVTVFEYAALYCFHRLIPQILQHLDIILSLPEEILTFPLY